MAVVRAWEWENDGHGHPLIREAPLEEPGGAGQFAALSRHLEYELRLAYANAHPGRVDLKDGDLIDQKEMNTRFESSSSYHNSVPALLKFAQYSGVPLRNGFRFKVIDFETFVYHRITANNRFQLCCQEMDGLERMQTWCEKGTVIGNIGIFDDYAAEIPNIYLGQGELSAIRTVVITAVRCIRGAYYFVYQDSHGLNSVNQLRKGRNIASFNVLLSAYKVNIPFPNELRGLPAM